MSSSSTSSSPSAPSSPPSSTGGSPMRRVERASLVTHGVTRNVDEAVTRLRAVAEAAGVELVDSANGKKPELPVALGGDGTMLRALTRFLATGVPVLGANFVRVGCLTAIPGA